MFNNMVSKSSYTSYSDCPCCGYKKSLATTIKNGCTLCHCHAGCSQDSLWRAIQSDRRPTYQQPAKTTQRVRNDSGKGFVHGLWGNSIPAKDTLVEIYLRSRGLTLPVPDAIRFLSKHQHKPTDTRWPVMIAEATNAAGEFQAIHRTYLMHDGKAKASVTPPKMTLGAVSGFAIHLAPAEATLAVSEGIETGLSVQQATGIPTWSAISAGGIQQLILPPLPLASTVIICADADPVGIKSAKNAAIRWTLEGRRVRIAAPPDGTDFNDIILQGAAI